MKRLSWFVLLNLAVVTSANAVPISSYLKGSKIMGHMPYMEYIASRVIVGGIKDEEGKWIGLQAGALLEIPSDLSKAEQEKQGIPMAFSLGDADGDIAASLGRNYTVAGKRYQGKVEFEVEWYIVRPKPGYRWLDKKTEPGIIVSDWSHVDAEPIDRKFYLFLNDNSQGIEVPFGAIGARIGFIATPTTEYGYPNKGYPVKAFDLFYIYQQDPIDFVGDGSSTRKIARNLDTCRIPKEGFCFEVITKQNFEGGGGDIVFNGTPSEMLALVNKNFSLE